MTDYNTDLEKDYLVIIRTGDGSFHRFNWFPADKFTLAEVEAKIIDFNKKHKNPDPDRDSYSAELIVDNKLAREICAYRQQSLPLAELIDNAAEIQKGIDKATEYLRGALSDLDSIRGLG